jgi:hypothetical protein
MLDVLIGVCVVGFVFSTIGFVFSAIIAWEQHDKEL